MALRSLFVLLSSVLLLAVGCADIDEPGEPALDSSPAEARAEVTASDALILEGSPEAVGIISFLNDSSTDFYLLDRDVRLNARSAATLIHHRDGADGIFGTWDDDPFDTIAEVDAVRWVGDGAINRILEYVRANQLVPRGDESLGVYDGVSFSVSEAAVVVDFVNRAPEGVLDRTLNRRAVDSILAARPIGSVEGLSNLYYVGRSALEQIKLLAIGGSI